MTVLKPAAESRFSVCWVWAQPATRAIKAKAEKRLKAIKVRFTPFCFPDRLLSLTLMALCLDIVGANLEVKGFSTSKSLLFWELPGSVIESPNERKNGSDRMRTKKIPPV